MGLEVSYMGTKRQLAMTVAEVIALSEPGPVLDLFSGMCAVGSAVAPARNVWCNDAQKFAVEVAAAFFVSTETVPNFLSIEQELTEAFDRNRRALERRFSHLLEAEDATLNDANAEQVCATDALMPNVATSKPFGIERGRLARKPSTFPYRLFSITFSGSYFGLRQCMEIDSVRYAIDMARDSNSISVSEHRWLLLALCQAASRVSSTTGHFAQYLKVKKTNVGRIARQRRRSVWEEWQSSITGLDPLGSASWREGNRVFQSDALSLLKRLTRWKLKPSVVYADPPYTNDQYSRYYHLYETLIEYDYPHSTGIGRYRPNRFRSTFSLKSYIAGDLERLIKKCAEMKSDLVLSYPTTGLLDNSHETIVGFLSKNYRRHEVTEIQHFHSSLGASKGVERHPVTEVIYRASI